MRAALLDGSTARDAALHSVHRVIVSELTGIACDVDEFILRDMTIAYCTGCFECWVRTPGICKATDAGHDVARAVIRSDLAVFLTPITFGGYSSELKKGLDHLIGLISPFFMKANGETHHKPRYSTYPRLIGVGVLPGPDSESEQIFTTLVGRNALNLHAPAHAAGVIRSGDSREAVGEAIRSLLAAAGVDH